MIRLLFVLLVAWSFSALAQPQNQVPAPPTSTQSNDDAPQDISVTGESLDSIAESVEAIAENTDPKNYAQPREQDRDITPLAVSILDLDAQRKMADYAALLFKTTIVQIVIGTLTLAGLLITIKQTTKMVREDKAWLGPGGAPVFQMIHLGGPNYSLKMNWRWANTGKSPAMDIEITRIVTHDFKKRGHEEVPPVEHDPNTQPVKAGFLGPDQDMTIPIEFTNAEFGGVLLGELRMYAVIKGTYRTVHSETIDVIHCFELIYQGGNYIKGTPPPGKGWTTAQVGARSQIKIKAPWF